MSTADKAQLFRSLHRAERPLALSNAWDVASALIAQAAGAPAVATTSAGVAWSLGQPDGDSLDRSRALTVIQAIAAAVDVPVTADIEAGYADTTDDVAETIGGVLAAGAVGINIEDGDRSPAELAARIAVARRSADGARVPLFINARTDVFLAGLGDPEQRLPETLTRATRYLDAGADGIFVPGVTDPETIGALTSGIAAPVNIMAGPGAPGVAELAGLGVARVSLGPALAQAAYATAQRAALELLGRGTYQATADGLDFSELNALFVESVTP